MKASPEAAKLPLANVPGSRGQGFPGSAKGAFNSKCCQHICTMKAISKWQLANSQTFGQLLFAICQLLISHVS
jgi:hypothetical protein